VSIKYSICALGLGLSLLAWNSSAAPIVITDEVSFDLLAAGSSLQTEGFNTVLPGGAATSYSSQIYGDITVTSSKFKIFYDDRYTSSKDPAVINGAIYAAPANTAMGYGQVTFTFANPINALAFDFMDLGSDFEPSTLILKTSNLEELVIVSNYMAAKGNEGFAAIYDNQNYFTSVTFNILTGLSSLEDIVSFDRFRYGIINNAGSEVPVPGALYLFMSALCSLSVLINKKKAKKS
jgi:hypothetical protein